MKSSNCIIMNLKQTVLMCLAFETCLSASKFKIGIYRTFWGPRDLLTTIISFNEDTLYRFQECLCNNLTKNCIAYQECHYEVCSVTYIFREPQQDLFNFHNNFNCLLEKDTKIVLCKRSLNQSNDDYTPLFHINYPFLCQLNCVEISWVYSQLAKVFYNPKDTIKPGIAPSTCNRLSSTATTSLTTQPTTTNTIFTPKQTNTSSTATVTTAFTSINHQTSISSTSTEDSFTTKIETDMFNGGNGGSDDKVPIIVGVTLSFFSLLALVIGLFLFRRWRKKNDAHTRRMSQKECVTDSVEPNSKNTMKYEIPSYCNINSDNQGYTNDTKEVHQTFNTDITDEYTVVNYSNGEFYQTNSEQPVFHSQDSQQSNSNVYLNSHQANDKGASGQTLINSNSFVADPEYSSIDQNTKETTYSNNEPLGVDTPQSEQMETYMNISKGQNPFFGEKDSNINDSHPVYYELDITKNYPESEKQEIGVIGGSPDAARGTHKVYSKLGDQSRHFNNPYNSLSGTVDSVTVTHLNVPAVNEESNLSPEYSLASSIDV